jgi:monofunctional biosynthetic peptidoglycan transglycosylase
MLRHSFKKRLLQWLAIILLAPYALTIVYWFAPPFSMLMLADVATLTLPKRIWVPMRAVSPNLVAAIVVAEDGAFCDHFGFDFNQIEKSIDKAVDGKRYGGASTITQQTVKNLYLWNGRSWLRKLLEAPITVWMELIMSKRRILEIYLNIAEWGDGIYGAEAAAHYYFGTTAANLSLQQAALLAAALPSPLERDAAHPGPYQLSQAVLIASRVQHHGPDISCVRTR